MDQTVSKPEFSHRPLKDEDLPLICGFPKSGRELFFMYPQAHYPLTYEQLKSISDQRSDSTVVLLENRVVGFADFYHCHPGESGAIGNVIVAPDTRRMGVGRFLIAAMIGIAVEKYRVKEIQICCFSQNDTGLLFYTRMGFKPVFIEEFLDKEGNRIASIHMTFNVNYETD
jgi:ribosomal protein S18 acetylase RimI-like enzyme